MRERHPIELADAKERLRRIGKVLMVGSGKGGVGKSVVACCLAMSLAQQGYRTALLDLDIHGASVPDYLGVSPPVKSSKEGLQPKKSNGLKVMSVGLFTGSNPVSIRGIEKQELITQLFGLTNWGGLDYLVVDLPPSMGDELLSAFGLFARKSTLVLVSTPSPSSVGVVSRLRRLAETENVAVTGVVLNMAYMRSGKVKMFPFGKPDRVMLEKKINASVIAEIPLEPSLSVQGLRHVLNRRKDISRAFAKIISQIQKQRPDGDNSQREPTGARTYVPLTSTTEEPASTPF